MASNVVVSGADEPDDEKVPAPRPAGGAPAKKELGFFTIYKRGQGKWTRLGTLFVAGLLGLLTTYNLYHYVLPYLPVYNPEVPTNHSADTARKLLFAGCVLFLAGFAVLTFWLTNRPRNADFMIATDSEMKKVNWTTKGELLGSTRVVVLFLFFVATFLFAVDLVFAKFFHLIRVLQ